jgi:hypothetical protein
MQFLHLHGAVRPQWWLTLAGVILVSSCYTGDATDTAASTDGMFHWTISTAIEIDAPPERVWSVLVDLPAYSEWNPFIVEASGKVAVGERLSLSMALPGRDPMAIAPYLLAVESGKELRWKGKLLLPGLFDGEHVFELTPLQNGRTRLDHWERFGGLLIPIARGMIYEPTVESFHALNAALARRAAAQSGAPKTYGH